MDPRNANTVGCTLTAIPNSKISLGAFCVVDQEGWLAGADVEEIDSLATLFSRAAFAAQQTLVVRLKAQEAKMRAELEAERRDSEAKEVARKERELCKVAVALACFFSD